LDKKREKNYRSVALKSRPCLSDEGVSLDGFSETQIIFSFLSTAAINFNSAVPSPLGEGAQRAGEVFLFTFLGCSKKVKACPA
jgi:hypothetical protein